MKQTLKFQIIYLKFLLLLPNEIPNRNHIKYTNSYQSQTFENFNLKML